MKGVIMSAYGNNDVISIAELGKPTVGPNDVLIQVVAASLNPLDFKIRDGGLRLVRRFPLPIVIGNDLSGRVVQVGPAVKAFAAGDEVYARVDKDKLGAFAEFAAVDAAFVAHKPKSLDFEAAAGVPLVTLTAWQALYDELKLVAGQRIFIPAGAGGVGGMAIQLAKLVGAHVTTSASSAGLALVKRYGADEVIDYKTQNPGAVVRGMDAVFDLLGGADLAQSFAMLKAGGKLVSIAGMPTGETMARFGKGYIAQKLFDLLSLKLRGAAKRHRVTYVYLFMRPDGAQLVKIADLLDAGKLTTVVDKVFPMAEAKAALAYAEAGRAKGKIILRIAP